MRRAQCTTPGYVYLIRSPQKSPHGSGKLYKIGCSRDPYKRLRALNSGPSVFTLVAICPTYDMYGLEARLHILFARKRINGEWFSLSEREVQKFNQYTVNAVTAIPHDAKAPKTSKEPSAPVAQRPVVLRKRLV